jgi:serine/threonine protein phosphatase 1
MVSNVRFFIGDVHGEALLLEKMLRFIENEAQRQGVPPHVTFLGDLIDRGPYSKSVLQLVRETLSLWPGSDLILGNHDACFLEVLRRRREDKYTKSWLEDCGGAVTFANFTSEPFIPLACQEVERQIPLELEMLHDAALILRYGPFIAAHAGINGMVPLDQQVADDILWIREGFLDRVDAFMPPVIHGHTIMEDLLPVVTENRISLDTGAFFSGKLTCLMLNHSERSLRFFQTTPGNVVEVQPLIVNRGKGTVYDRMKGLYKAYAASLKG